MTRNVHEKEYMSSEETLNFLGTPAATGDSNQPFALSLARSSASSAVAPFAEPPCGSPFKSVSSYRRTGTSEIPVSGHISDMPKSTRLTQSGRELQALEFRALQIGPSSRAACPPICRVITATSATVQQAAIPADWHLLVVGSSERTTSTCSFMLERNNCKHSKQ
jgi:hypothetical protein